MNTNTVELPAPTEFKVDGHTVTVTYEDSWGVTARIGLPPVLLRYIDSVVEAAYNVVDSSFPPWRYSWVVVDEAGNEVVSSPVPSSLRFYYAEHAKRERREQNYDTLNSDLVALMRERERLQAMDLPVGELATALHAARKAVDSIYDYWENTTFAQAQGALARVRNLIAEIEGSFVNVVVRGLMSRAIYHSDVSWNEELRRSQLSLWVRIGGDMPLAQHVGDDAIDLLTDSRLAAIYTEKLLDAGVKNLTEVQNTSLALDRDTYAPEWLLEVPELNAAPAEITIVTSKRTVGAKVTYSLRDDAGVLVPTGTATMSLNEYKTARTIPALPHGIELVLVLTAAGEEAVRGPVGDLLTKRVKSYKGGQQRGKNSPPGDLIGRRGPVQAGELPPWGPARVRWR